MDARGIGESKLNETVQLTVRFTKGYPSQGSKVRKRAGGQWENEIEGKCLLPSINTLGIYGTHALHSIVSWSEMQSVVAVVGGSGRNSRMAGHSSSHFTDRSGYPAFRVSKPVVSLVI